MKKMEPIIALLLIAVILLLPNTISAGPPIGYSTATVDPDPASPGQPMKVKICWWMNSDYSNYYGPFDISIKLYKVNPDGSTDDMKETDFTTKEPIPIKVFDYKATEAFPYCHTISGNAYSDPGNYYLNIKIEATNKQDSKGKLALVASTDRYFTTTYAIPEFTTIAIPVGAIIGLLFFFNRKRSKQ